MRILILITIFIIPFVTFSQNELDKNFQKAEASFVKENYTNAFKHYKKSSDDGNTWAKLSLSYMYNEGLGIEKDEHKAKELYNQCYKEGYRNYSDGQFEGYLRGESEVFDVDKYYYWSTQMYHYYPELVTKTLGLLYYYNLISDKTKLEHIYNLFQKHSEDDCVFQFYIGLMYKNGDYLTMDNEKAKDWFNKAVTNGCDFVEKKYLK